MQAGGETVDALLEERTRLCGKAVGDHLAIELALRIGEIERVLALRGAWAGDAQAVEDRHRHGMR